MLQPKLNLRVSQRQVLTPGLVQMVSVLALNKLELKEMMNTEMVENPVLEELDEIAMSLDERSGLEGDRERSAEDVAAESERAEKEEKDPFDEIDFGSYFQEYLDPGYKTASNFEEYDKPSFEHFLAQPSTLTDHLAWQLGALTVSPGVRIAAELVVGNLNENGYLTATDEELAEVLLPGAGVAGEHVLAEGEFQAERALVLADVVTARELVNYLDPVGVGTRDLRECLLVQIASHRKEAELELRRREARRAGQVASRGEEAENLEEYGAAHEVMERRNGPIRVVPSRDGASAEAPGPVDVFAVAATIVEKFLSLLQKKDMRELTRSCGCGTEDVQAAVDFIRTLDPRPGQRYNQGETRLIEPDVAFVKRDGVYVVLMNEEDLPTLRLNQGYRKMLREKQTEKEVKEYVKERYKSAIQLLRNIEQRKNTIVRTCEVIVRRQQEFLERGEQGLKPMMIKEVAEELGVHPSTVSRAVANKYVHTSQGVYELRFFFSEGVGGPEGGDLPLVLLKRKVKQMIEGEDARKPWTDDQLAALLQKEGIQVTRRTVAKYREDLQIPSTHQRRVR